MPTTFSDDQTGGFGQKKKNLIGGYHHPLWEYGSYPIRIKWNKSERFMNTAQGMCRCPQFSIWVKTRVNCPYLEDAHPLGRIYIPYMTIYKYVDSNKRITKASRRLRLKLCPSEEWGTEYFWVVYLFPCLCLYLSPSTYVYIYIYLYLYIYRAQVNLKNSCPKWARIYAQSEPLAYSISIYLSIYLSISLSIYIYIHIHTIYIYIHTHLYHKTDHPQPAPFAIARCPLRPAARRWPRRSSPTPASCCCRGRWRRSCVGTWQPHAGRHGWDGAPWGPSSLAKLVI